MRFHHQLVNRVEVKGELVLDTGLHVGGAKVGKRDALVIRNAYGRPFIPGSSLKGAFRSRVESLVHILNPSAEICFMSKGSGATCLSAEKDGPKQIQVATKKGPTALAEVLGRLCITCRLFGGASWKSRISFDDLHQVGGWHVPIERRDGVGLDRDTRRAVKGVIYGLEAVPAETRFMFSVSGENLTDQERRLFAAGLLELNQGHIPIGGKTSRGLGSCHLDAATLKISDFRLNALPDLESYLLGTHPPESNAEMWLKAQLGLSEVHSC